MKNLYIKITTIIIILIFIGGLIMFVFWKNNSFSVSVKTFFSDKSSDSKIYKSDKYQFSFSYPKGFNASDFTDSDGDIILVKNAAADNGFQIHISSFDETGQVTKERILKDLPDLVINNDHYIDINGKQALSFESQDELGKKIIEIWLNYGSHLYQIMGYENFREEIMKILDTWKFQ